MKFGIEGVMDEWRQMQESINELQKENAELRECLKEALSGIDEFMTRTIYFEHGKDIERWRAALEKASGEEVK